MLQKIQVSTETRQYSFFSHCLAWTAAAYARSRLSSGLVILILPANPHPTLSSCSSIEHSNAREVVTESPSPDLVFQGVPFNFQLKLLDFLPLSLLD